MEALQLRRKMCVIGEVGDSELVVQAFVVVVWGGVVGYFFFVSPGLSTSVAGR